MEKFAKNNESNVWLESPNLSKRTGMIHEQPLYWTAKSSFFFLTSDQPEAEILGPKLHPGVGFFGKLKKFTSRSI